MRNPEHSMELEALIHEYPEDVQGPLTIDAHVVRAAACILKVNLYKIVPTISASLSTAEAIAQLHRLYPRSARGRLLEIEAAVIEAAAEILQIPVAELLKARTRDSAGREYHSAQATARANSTVQNPRSPVHAQITIEDHAAHGSFKSLQGIARASSHPLPRSREGRPTPQESPCLKSTPVRPNDPISCSVSSKSTPLVQEDSTSPSHHDTRGHRDHIAQDATQSEYFPPLDNSTSDLLDLGDWEPGTDYNTGDFEIDPALSAAGLSSDPINPSAVSHNPRYPEQVSKIASTRDKTFHAEDLGSEAWADLMLFPPTIHDRYEQSEQVLAIKKRRGGGVSTACARCIVQKSKCVSSGPGGLCENCAKPKAFKVPCEKDGLQVIQLFRTGSSRKEYDNFPLQGIDAGRLALIPHGNWDLTKKRIIILTQGEGSFIFLDTHRFEVPEGLTEFERSMFTEPWGIMSLRDVSEKAEVYVGHSLKSSIRSLVEPESITGLVFQYAQKLIKGNNPLLYYVIRFWGAARSIEKSWTVHELDGRSHAVLDHQMAALFVSIILEQLRTKILPLLSEVSITGRKSDWISLFLASYILLHHLEVLMRQQAAFTEELGMQVLYSNMPLIGELQIAAKTILMRYHAACAGRSFMSPDWNWDAKNLPFRKVDADSREFMKLITEKAKAQERHMNAATAGDVYHLEGYFTGQLFEQDWGAKHTSARSPLRHTSVDAAMGQ